MIIINKSKVKKVLTINDRSVTINPNSRSSDLILSLDDIRNLVISNTPEELNFILTNSNLEVKLLSEVGADPNFIHKDE